MADLFNDIQEFKVYIGGGANVSLRIESITPVIGAALRNHLTDWLGVAFQTELLLAHSASPSDAQTAAIKLLQKSLAPLTMFEYSKIGGVQFGESGLIRIENEYAKTAYKYQETEYRRYMLSEGYNAKEELLQFLDSHAADYTTWANADAAKKTRNSFVAFASVFRTHYRARLGRYDYEVLRPIIDDITEYALIPLWGEPLYEDLKAKWIANNLSIEEANLIRLAQKAVVNYTMEQGLERHYIRMEQGRVVTVTDGNDLAVMQQAAMPKGVSMKHLHHQRWANKHLQRISDYLKANATAFPLYVLEAAEETAVTESRVSREWWLSGRNAEPPGRGIVHF